MAHTHPLIGTAVWIQKEGTLMLSKRASGKSGAGTWCVPGGHLEMFETIEECCVREVREEAGVEIGNLRLLTYIESYDEERGTHFVTFHYAADWTSGDPRPQAGESEEWHWFALDALPEPLFEPTQELLRTGINPLEITA
ncbi:MAG TPA: NUDIX domain-containing protein [Candidatus Paceibacterota bacterium]|nr:NUDIX domain-containing protein [Candidatus Paceibacterota bacterium]